MLESEFLRIWEGLRNGERLYLSKAITLAETSSPALFPFRDRLLENAEKVKSHETLRLAITGVPGAGKSTFINRLGLDWISQGCKVAVLAIDPSSEMSLGSVLGDKTRMAELAREENAFIRPSPTRLHLGGVAASTYETILLCEAAGYNRIIVETVGVGQSELEAAQLSDVCLLLLVAGAGDELQAVKRGVLEAADFILINKADGDNIERAHAAARELAQTAQLWNSRPGGNRTEVFSGSSLAAENQENWTWILSDFFAAMVSSGYYFQNRKKQEQRWLNGILWNRMEEILKNNSSLQALIHELEQKRENCSGIFNLLNELTNRVVIHVNGKV